jgi:hypothetical protein
MSKTLVIGDLHGRPYWKQIIAKEKPNRVIFIGDYFDSFDYTTVEQIHNFKEIIEYKESGDADVIILIGNHDYHYMRGVTEYYSGYQTGTRPAIEQLLDDNKHHLDIIYQFNYFLFSHAGVSYDWLIKHGWDGTSNVVDYVKDVWLYKPNSFMFDGYDPYGDSKISSPIWIRPNSLQKSNKDTELKTKYIQIVGHTQQKQIDIKNKATNGRYYYIDTLSTSGEYMIIEDGVISFNTYKKIYNIAVFS